MKKSTEKTVQFHILSAMEDHNLTMDDIAARAGCDRSAIYSALLLQKKYIENPYLTKVQARRLSKYFKMHEDTFYVEAGERRFISNLKDEKAK